MKCNNCNTEYVQGQKFCKVCGAKLDEQNIANTQSTDETKIATAAHATQNVSVKNNNVVAKIADENQSKESSKKPNDKFKYVIGAVALVLIVFICSKLFNGSGNTDISTNKWYNYTNSDGEIVYINSETDKKIVIEDDIYSVQAGYYNNNFITTTYDGDLYVVTKNGKEKIASDVRQASISVEENKVLYIDNYTENYDYNVYSGDLYIYDISSKKSKKIDSDVIFSYNVNLLCMSPNGKAITYVKNYDEEEEKYDVYMSINGKSGKKINKNCLYFGLTDDGKITYYGNIDDTYIYASNDGKKLKIANNLESIFMNKDCTQAIVTDDDMSYIVDKGKNKEKISCCISEIIDADFCNVTNYNLTMTYTNVKNFFDHTMYTPDDSYVTINKKYEVTEFEDLYDAYWNTYYAHGTNKLYYVEDGSIFVIDCSKPESKKLLLEDEDVSEMYVTSNGKHIYYVNYDGELYYLNGKKSVKLADDVGYIVLNENGIIYFIDYDSEEQLYYSKSGSKKAKVENSEEIVDFSKAGDTIYFIVEDENSDNGMALYKVTSKGKSEKVTDDIIY